MQKKSSNLLLLCLLFTVFSNTSAFSKHKRANSQKLPSSSLSFKGARQKYWAIFKKFRNKVCTPNTMERFNDKLSKYRGEGFYLPIINNKVYPEVLDGVLNELELKRKWLVNSIIQLKKLKKLPRIYNELSRSQSSVNKILKLQEKSRRFNQKLTTKDKKQLAQSFETIKTDLSTAIDKSFYLTRYRFPVDHFSNRRKHDALYGSKRSLVDKKKQKEIFLLRKLLEDGAPGSSHSGSDRFFRTTLDTVALKLPTIGDNNWLSESERYDLEYIIRTIKKLSKNSPWHYVQRFRKWRDKTKEQISFYNELRTQAKSPSQKLKKTLAKKKQATSQLSSFVYAKQFEAYEFWMKQPAYFRALYSLETILFNEVGGIDPSGLERSDVLQVVLNRYQQKYYRRLKKKQSLYRRASAKGIKRDQFPWLNILLNRGEFSFTLYYFKASHETFCPSMSKELQKLRDSNLKIAYEILRKPRYDFKAERYFSRHSMTGRIDMSEIWSKFYELDERVGRALNQRIESREIGILNKKLMRNEYRYLYSIADTHKVDASDIGNKNKLLHVLEIDGKNYVLRESSKINEWYEHRNPHYFRYFAVK